MGYSGGRAGYGGGFDHPDGVASSHGKIWYTYTSGGITYESGTHFGSGVGGGMSGVFRASITANNAIIIAGGGGGAGGNVTYQGTGAGAGGGDTGAHGSRYPGDNSGGRAGTQFAGGAGETHHRIILIEDTNGSRFKGGDGNKSIRLEYRVQVLDTPINKVHLEVVVLVGLVVVVVQLINIGGIMTTMEHKIVEVVVLDM